MAAANVVTEVAAYGHVFRRTVPVTTDGAVIKDQTLDAAKVGALTTRTDNDTGELTMAAGHGILTGQRFDLYWGTGKRIGITAGTVATNAVPFDGGGSGDNLPADETPITAMVPRLESFAVTAADMLALLVGCSATQATAVFRQADATLVATVSPTGAAGSSVWESTSGATTPFGANVADVYLSHGDSAQAWPVIALAMVN